MPEARAKRENRRKRVLVVDDHPVLCQGIAQIIGAQMDLECCGQVTRGETVMDRVAEDDPDIVLMDISLNGADGLSLIKQVRARRPAQAILVYSMHDEMLYAERALQAGAMGFVNKQAAPETLIGAIRRVLDGKIHLSDVMSDRLLRRMAGQESDVSASPVETLSDRELQVLRLMGQGLATRQIAKHLGISIKTVNTYRENLKAKLGQESGNELIRFATLWAAEDD